VTVDKCQIVDNDYRLVLKCVLDYFKELNVTYYHRVRHEGYLRHLLVRKAQKTGEMLIALVTTTKQEYDLKPLVDKLLELPLAGKITGVLHTKNDSVADTIQSDETQILYGQDYFYEEILGLKFKISQFSFFQTNTLGAEVLYETAREFMGDISGDKSHKSTVFDLYSGTGTIAQLLAPVAGKVIGVEIVEEAVEAARQNAELNGLTNCEFIAGDVLKVIDDITDKPDFIVLDPPRDGIHPKAIQKIIDYKAERIVYISCKPTSLARDLEALIGGGYRMERVVAIDEFPATAHTETIVRLCLKN
jgi:23S rRNA (uracil-5-)-methyltransferase RumA